VTSRKRSGGAKRSSSKRGLARRKKDPQELTAAELEGMAEVIAPYLHRCIDKAWPSMWCHWWNEMEEGAEKKRLEAFLFPGGNLRDDFDSKKVKKTLKQMCCECRDLATVITQEFTEGLIEEIRKDRLRK